MDKTHEEKEFTEQRKEMEEKETMMSETDNKLQNVQRVKSRLKLNFHYKHCRKAATERIKMKF